MINNFYITKQKFIAAITDKKYYKLVLNTIQAFIPRNRRIT